MNGTEFVEKYVKKGKILSNKEFHITGGLDLSQLGIKKIENLPERIDGSLYLSDNKISKIENLPKKISYGLYLDHNEIEKIENLPFHIKGLNLSNNKISKIENLENYNLSELSLSNNKIKRIENLPNADIIFLLKNYPTEYEIPTKKFDQIIIDSDELFSTSRAKYNLFSSIKLSPDEKMFSFNEYKNFVISRIKKKNIGRIKEMF